MSRTRQPLDTPAGPSRSSASIRLVHGDLLDQPVDVIVNAWNRNVLPWWLLLPQGVSRSIKKRAGTAPFRELRRAGVLPLGAATLTSAGRLPFRAIIHVAGIDLLWRASERSIRGSVTSATRLALEHGFTSLALPLLGAGSIGMNAERSRSIILGQLQADSPALEVRVVSYSSAARPRPGES